MVVYDLKCGKSHLFEAWFRDSGAYEAQSLAGKVACPVCGSKKVARAPMAPNVARGSRDLSSSEQKQQAKQMLTLLKDMREKVEKNADYVGPKFAEEARKIHYGEIDKRSIYGEASKDEADELTEEGIEFGVIPWLPRHDA